MDEPPHIKVYQTCLDYLVNSLQVDDVLPSLLAKEIISRRNYELVKCKKASEGSTSASELFIMEVMIRDPDRDHFLRFIEILEEAKQGSIAKKLRTEYKVISGQELEADVPSDSEIPKGPVPNRPTTRVVTSVIESPPQEQRHYVSKEGLQIDSLDLAHQEQKHYVSKEGFQMDSLDLAQAAGNKKRQPVPPANMTLIPSILNEQIDLAEIDINRKNRLGRGKFGCVYRCDLSGTDVAVKELEIPTGKNKPTEMSQLLKNEINVSASARHPSIVQFMGYSIEKQSITSYLLLFYELIDGHNLNDILSDEELIPKYDFNLAKRYRVLLQVSQALAYLHGQDPKIIHGDIKPANVMLTRFGKAKVCDLGLSKLKQDSNAASLVTTAGARGTPIYMAPEQLLFQKTSSTYSDVYAFGAFIYEVLFREYMWDLGDDDLNDRQKLKDKMQAEKVPHKLRKMAGQPAHNVILKCVKFDYNQRSDSLSLVSDLQGLCSSCTKSPEQG